jgi:signal transduction histidine kinase
MALTPPMGLADFILKNMEAILRRWEDFASTQMPAAASMKPLELRDHAEHMLKAIAKDLNSSQTRSAQTEKSKGNAPKQFGAPETAAQTHAVLRARSGFDVIQLVAEYRALRASVLRLWMDAHPLANETDPDDMIRFNEAIDQALAESISFFTTQVDETRNLMLGMLSHDMRSPLQTIQMTASYLAATNAGSKVSEAAVRLTNSAVRIKTLLDDLLDFNRASLGLGISVRPEKVDVETLVGEELSRLRGAHPHRRIALTPSGDLHGTYDGLRLQQVVDNLVSNALKYGKATGAVQVVLHGNDSGIHLDVVNEGITADAVTLNGLFEPLKRGPQHAAKPEADGSVGLGLYISREIAKAHGGSIEARTTAQNTVFSVRLPRRS